MKFRAWVLIAAISISSAHAADPPGKMPKITYGFEHEFSPGTLPTERHIHLPEPSGNIEVKGAVLDPSTWVGAEKYRKIGLRGFKSIGGPGTLEIRAIEFPPLRQLTDAEILSLDRKMGYRSTALPDWCRPGNACAGETASAAAGKTSFIKSTSGRITLALAGAAAIAGLIRYYLVGNEETPSLSNAAVTSGKLKRVPAEGHDSAPTAVATPVVGQAR